MIEKWNNRFFIALNFRWSYKFPTSKASFCTLKYIVLLLGNRNTTRAEMSLTLKGGDFGNVLLTFARNLPFILEIQVIGMLESFSKIEDYYIFCINNSVAKNRSVRFDIKNIWWGWLDWKVMETVLKIKGTLTTKSH